MISPGLARLLLFQPSGGALGEPPVLAGIPGRDVSLTTTDGVSIHGWWYDRSPSPAVLLLHGNAGNISNRTPLALGLLQEGLSVFLLEYRGYGASEGRPTEEGLLRDAQAGYEFLRAQEGVTGKAVVFGRSMGGAVAAGLATSRDVGAVILESSFTSLEAMGRALYPFLPGILFRRLRGRFSTLERVRELRVPLLVIHGTRDGIVPHRMGRELRQAGGQETRWLSVEEAGHNDVFQVGGPHYFRTIGEFVKESAGR